MLHTMPNKPITTNYKQREPTTRHLINNTLTEPTTERPILGSDGSLHLHDQVAVAAWIISAGPDSFILATFIMKSNASHCIKLEGILRALHHLDYLNITPQKWLTSGVKTCKRSRTQLIRYKTLTECWKQRQTSYSQPPSQEPTTIPNMDTTLLWTPRYKKEKAQDNGQQLNRNKHPKPRRDW